MSAAAAGCEPDLIARFEAWRLRRRVRALNRAIAKACAARVCLEATIRDLCRAKSQAEIALIDLRRLG